ncbi:MAG TPA: PAS domain S-box protein [Bradyrhizobium sp.]|uniref:sensor domain-containing diguanylate cyclase n=1 Tax=Bradyrhizobium sp. TaxID=376 RepID=UPI002D7EA0B8|nr:PAS domain S-box protein [Bradyrhizobium sp.]HET7888671.1 PAS domain S-box protein [Bradyrhizobium sp.]
MSRPTMLPPTATDNGEDFEARVRREVLRRMAMTPAMLHSIDAKGRLVSVSDNWLAKLGYAREEVLGRHLTEFVAPATREHVVKNLLPEFLRAGRCDNAEYQILCKDGRAIDVLLSAVLHRDPAGGEPISIAAVTDITAMKEAERQVAESEARYRMFADNSTDIIALLDRDGGRRYVSPSCFAMTGYTPEEMQASRTADTTHPDDVARVLEVLANMTSECTVTYRMRLKAGGYIWVETTCKPLAGAGQTDLRMCIVRNVDARMRAEQKLQESESRYRLLADNATDLIMTVAQDGTRSYVSPACENLLGYTPEEMLLINSLDTVHPEDVSTVHLMLANKSERPDQHPRTYTYRIRRKDGSYIWVETTARAVEIAGDEGQRQLIIRDIEQRMKSEQELKESEARYRLLADNSTDMVFRLDTDLVRRYISPACREILGYEPEEMLAIKPIDMVHPEDAPRLALIFQTLLSGKADRHSIINRIRHQNGRWIWVEAQLRALRDPDGGAVTGIIGALRDISVRKAIEDELAEANRRLRALAGQDSLTGLANRRAFDEALAREHLRSRRDKTALGLIMIDVDHFQRFNDLYGHLAGDDCLRCVGAAIGAALLRPGDLAARYGGEEFAVLLPDTDEAGAAVTAERIREAIFGLNIRHAGNSNGVVTISSGVASLNCSDIEADRLIAAADQALYRAKDFGRNAVCRAGDVTPGDGAAANVA